MQPQGPRNYGSRDSVAWLEAETERVWLLAERRLRALRESARTREPHPVPGEAERLLAVRAGRAPDQPPPRAFDLIEPIERITTRLVDLRNQAPIGQLAGRLGLDELELEVLALSVVPQVDPDLGVVFTQLQNDHARRGLDLALIAELLELDRSGRLALLEVIEPGRPLVARRLVEVGGSDPRSALFRGIQPTLDLLPMLQHTDQLSPALRGAGELSCASAELDDLILDDAQRVRLEAVTEAIARMTNRTEPAWAVLWGPEGAGKRTIAGRIAARAGRPLLVLDTRVVEHGQGDEMLRRAVREALFHRAVLYIGGLAGRLLDDGAGELVRRLRDYGGPLILGVCAGQAPQIRSERVIEEVELIVPGPAARLELWQRAIPEPARSGELDLPLLSRSFRLTPGEILDIGAGMVTVEGATGVRTASVRAAVDRRLRNQLSDLARRVEVTHGWDQLVLPRAQVDSVREIIERHRHGDTVYQQWGLGKRVGYGRGIITLLSGPPGTGKTMLAGLVAAELGLDLYKVDLSQVVSKWVGETEKQLARIFDLAARAHAVLLFDEADSLLGARTKVETANDRYGNLAVSYLLSRFEDYDGVIILTTNMAKSLDSAIKRRLTLHLRLDPPDEHERLQLWRSFLPDSVPQQAELELEQLADEFELSGGYIKNAAIRAAFLAASEASAVGADHLRRAVRLEMDNLGRLS